MTVRPAPRRRPSRAHAQPRNSQCRVAPGFDPHQEAPDVDVHHDAVPPYAKAATAAVYSPTPGSSRSVASSAGTSPSNRSRMMTDSCRRLARRGYPDVPRRGSPRPRSRRRGHSGSATVGAIGAMPGGPRLTGVCCSMISLTYTPQGSLSRQGGHGGFGEPVAHDAIQQRHDHILTAWPTRHRRACAACLPLLS